MDLRYTQKAPATHLQPQLESCGPDPLKATLQESTLSAEVPAHSQQPRSEQRCWRAATWILDGTGGSKASSRLGQEKSGPVQDRPTTRTISRRSATVREWISLCRPSSPTASPETCGTRSHAWTWQGFACGRCCRSTRSADPQRQEQPDPIGWIPRSGCPSRSLLILLPDPLQRLPEPLGGGGCLFDPVGRPPAPRWCNRR